MYGGDEQSLNYCLIIAKCTWKPELLCVAILKTQDLILQLRQLTSPTVLHQVCWAGILCLWSILVPFCEDRKSPVLPCPGQADREQRPSPHPPRAWCSLDTPKIPAGWWPQSPCGTELALLLCQRGTDTVTPTAGHEETHPHPTGGV